MDPQDAPGNTDYRALAARMGYGALRRRLKKQAGLWAKDQHQGMGLFVVEAVIPVNKIIEGIIRFSGFEAAGKKNLLDFEVVENTIALQGLPDAFEGFRLLQISDLHCDLYPPVVEALIPLLETMHYDAVVFTGDYHNKIASPPEESLLLMKRIIETVGTPRYGILGNHDFIEKVAFLEAVGLPILLNESVALGRNSQKLWLCGIDDPHFFQAADLVRASAGIPAGEAAILLSHSPEPYEEAERLGFGAMLCGHTHGGQICLPGGVPIIRNTRAPRRFLAGEWRHGTLRGYTSRGAGACGVAARFFCRPEVTIHILRRAQE